MSGEGGTRSASGAGEPASMERREFLGAASLAAGGIAFSAAVPWAATAPPAAAASRAAPSVPAASAPGRLEDWTIDDVWGAYPRYADPIGFGRRPEESPAGAAAADPLAYC